MWTKIKALPLRVKIIALVVFVALSGIYGHFTDVARSSNAYNSSYGSGGASSPAPGGSSISESAGQSRSADSSQVLENLLAQYHQIQQQNAQCMTQENPMYPPPPCEAQMQVNVALMAKLEAEITRLQTGANVEPMDFVLMGSSSRPSSSAGTPISDSSNGAGRFSREAILGQSKYTDSDGKEYQLANQPYYFKDRVSGTVVGSDYAQPPDNQHDWEPLTYQPN